MAVLSQFVIVHTSAVCRYCGKLQGSKRRQAFCVRHIMRNFTVDF